MEATETSSSVLNLRPAIVLFFGEDAFPVRHLYEDSLGKGAGVQRILSLSEKADLNEWREELDDAFQLFTAVSMKKAVEDELLTDAEVHRVSVFIVVRSAVDKYSELVQVVVECAQLQSLADKLEFITITDVRRSDDLASKAASLHRPVEAIACSMQLQNSVLAVSDYWQGVRIGSDEQTCLALARIAALLTLSEYCLANSHIGYLRNVVLGGRTHWVGLGAYSASRIDLCATIIYADVVRETVGRLLARNPQSIVGDLCDEVYSAVLAGVANRIGRLASSDDESETIKTAYATEVAPRILEEVCRRVKSPNELLTVLEHLASRLRTKTASSAITVSSSAAVVPMSLFMLSPEAGVAAGVVGLAAVACLVWLLRRRTGRDATSQPIVDVNPTSASDSVPHDALLADVVDDLRREMAAKLLPATDKGNLHPLASGPEGMLVGEQRLSMKQMLRSENAKAAGRAMLESTPHRLILLALESGKWRTPAACRELLAVQKEAVRAIASTLRHEFIDWTISGEQHRFTDKNFVQQVLYAPPPPPGASVSQVCIAPVDWALPDLPLAVDRSYLPNCIHFMYLVETNVSN